MTADARALGETARTGAPPPAPAGSRGPARRQPRQLGAGRSHRPDAGPRRGLYSYLNPMIDFVKTYKATGAAKVQLHEAQRENDRLHWRIQHWTTRSCSTKAAARVWWGRGTRRTSSAA